MPEVCESIVIARPLEVVFGFHKNPRNLNLIAPGNVKSEVIDADMPMTNGSKITVRFYFGPLPLSWISVVENYIENVEFTEVSLKGPFKRWHHRHLFEAVPEGTRLTETVDYEAPLGALGLKAAQLFMGMGLDKVFQERQKNTKAYLENQT